MAEIQSSPPVKDALQYWCQQPTCGKKLAAFAEDLISAPASQAYVKRIFSLCGFLSAGRRMSAMRKSLAMRTCLKLNSECWATLDLLINTTLSYVKKKG
jgi:hypothetical protein